MPAQSIKVFVSYSRDDESLVAPVVRLLRVNTSYVFQDVDGIRPGKRWREEIARGIAEADLVVVFWCSHAWQSVAVSEEWSAAIEQKKDLLPLLLDATPLPQAMSEFQYIDFRGTVGENHCSGPPGTDRSMPSMSSEAPSPTRSLPSSATKHPARWLSVGGVAAALLVAVTFLVVRPVSQGPEVDPAPASPGQTSPPTVQPSQPPSIGHPSQKAQPPLPAPPPPPESTSTWLASVIELLLIGLALVAGTIWYFRKKRRPETSPGSRDVEIPPDLIPRPSSSWENTGMGWGIERQMASEIEAEIARRTST
jgi:LPXTG-motif cell wall-anchored protein